MQPVRILIVEDERMVSAHLCRRLGRMGHTVAGITSSGEEAIEHAHRLQPDLVLMDVQLRGPMDGIEAARHIGAMPGRAGLYGAGCSRNRHSAPRSQRAGSGSKPWGTLVLHGVRVFTIVFGMVRHWRRAAVIATFYGFPRANSRW